MNWTNRDWIWLTSILVGLIIFIFSFRLSDNQRVTEIFSFLSSGVSIALAFVAIYVSSNQNKETQTLSLNMSETLARLDEKIHSINEKVEKFDPRSLTQDVDERIKTMIENANEYIPEDKFSKTEAIQYFNEQLNNLKDDINNQIIKEYTNNSRSSELTHEMIFLAADVRKITRRMNEFNIKELSEEYMETYNKIPSFYNLKKAVDHLVRLGALIPTDKQKQKFINVDNEKNK
jgi:uncharacterized protein YoxC